jgi:hypothetical protein
MIINDIPNVTHMMGIFSLEELEYFRDRTMRQKISKCTMRMAREWNELTDSSITERAQETSKKTERAIRN